MKFLMTTTFYPPFHIGGDAVFVKRLSEELANRGHEVHVMFSYDAYKLKGYKEDKNIIHSKVHLHILDSPRGRWSPISAYVKGKSSYYSSEFERLVKEISPDVVNHHNISLLGYDMFFRRGRYVNIYTVQDHWPICQLNGMFKDGMVCDESGSCMVCAVKHRRPPQLWRRGKKFKSAKGNLDGVIFSSKYMESMMSEEFDCKKFVLPNFVPSPPTDIALPPVNNYYMYSGVLEGHKGVFPLLNTWFGMRCYGGTDAALVFSGEGSLKKELEEQVKEYVDYGVKNLFVLGHCEENRLYSLYCGAKALVVPSRCPDNNPLVALEALSVGTPVLTSRVGGLPEIANMQGEGFCGDLVRAIRRIDDGDRPSREFLKKIYADNFSPEVYVDKYIKAVTM